MKVLLTAPPSTGKSTVIESVVRGFSGYAMGVIAREVIDLSGVRCGFEVVDSRGNSEQFMTLATDCSDQLDTKIGRFSVDIESLESIALPELSAALARNAHLLYIDEIGRAQAKSLPFLDVVRQAIDSRQNLLGSIVYESEPFSLEFKTNPRCCVVEVTEFNRDHLPEILLSIYNSVFDFYSLTPSAQLWVNNIFKRLLQNGEFIAARKLFDNAIPYVLGNRLELLAQEGNILTYRISGQTNVHFVALDSRTDLVRCDCDLSNGRGQFVSKLQTCSHEMAIRIVNA